MKRPNQDIRAALQHLGAGKDDFRIAGRVGAGYVARTRAGGVAWVVPLENIPETPGRKTGGFALAPNPKVAFEFEGRRWNSPAAVWESTEPELLDTFLVLLDDAVFRLGRETTWAALVGFVDEWQLLLSRRTALTTEQQLGLWAELRVLESSTAIDRLAAGWQGPDGGAVDFFVDGKGLEVKASRRKHSHHVSQSQADAPVGDHESALLSFWVNADPIAGRSLVELVEAVIERVTDKPAFLKQLGRVGYSVADAENYRAIRFIELEAPLLFERTAIPRLTDIPSAISELRYLVTLDASQSMSASQTKKFKDHFRLELAMGTAQGEHS